MAEIIDLKVKLASGLMVSIKTVEGKKHMALGSKKLTEDDFKEIQKLLK